MNSPAVNSSLTVENRDDLEWTKKIAFKIILKDNYINYQDALNILELDASKERHDQLCLKLAKKYLSNEKMKNLFPPNNRSHMMKPRNY